ncbi:MAG TPA: hypothetical protein ENN05_08245 [Deltaproteobacteria bacterium]|nr:hypothetical protein [Deltaproteobacteria bacterium]
MNDSRKGRFTIRSAAAMFMLSAVFEFLSLTSAMPLFGAVRSGTMVAVYHVFFAGLFLTIGVGLWAPKKWGIKAAVIGGIFYSLDKILFILDRTTIEIYLVQLIGVSSEIFEVIDRQALFNSITLMYLLFIALWWGFVGYLHLRRQYFNTVGQ